MPPRTSIGDKTYTSSPQERVSPLGEEGGGGRKKERGDRTHDYLEALCSIISMMKK
jgi:hypothetical protein